MRARGSIHVRTLTNIAMAWFALVATLSAAEVRCLPLDDARRAMADESHEPFFSVLQPREIAAMTGAALPPELTAEQRRDEVRRRFVAAVEPFAADEERALTSVVTEVCERLQPHYPLMADRPWLFVKFDDRLVGGFPHTRGPWIFLSERFLRRTTAARTEGRRGEALQGVEATLVHEQMHVLERFHPERFRTLFVEQFGFRFGAVQANAWIDERKISNPDAMRWEWAFPLERDGAPRWYAMQMLLRDGPEVPVMGRDFEFVGVRVEPYADGFRPLQTNGRPVVEPIRELRGYFDRFPTASGLDHPNELAAYLFSAVYLADQREEPNAGPKRRSLEPYRRWFRDHLK